MFTNWNQFITWEKSTKDTIDVKKTYIDISGDFMAGVLLSQIIYWYLPNKQGKSKLRVKKEGHYWIAKKREEWYEEIRFTEANYKTAIKKLEKEKLVVKERFKFNGAPTTHIRLNISVFLRKLNELLQKEQDNLDDELKDFNQYLEQETKVESLCTMDSVKSTEWKRSNQPNEFGEIDQINPVKSTESLTESTKKITKEITKKCVCPQEQEILTLLEERPDIDQNTHTNIIKVLHFAKKKETFSYSIFIDTLDLVDFDLYDLSYFKRAISNNLKKGYVSPSKENKSNLGTKKTRRTELVPDWLHKDDVPDKSKEKAIVPKVSEERKREIWAQVKELTVENKVVAE